MKIYSFSFSLFFTVAVAGQIPSTQLNLLMNYSAKEFNFNGVVLIAKENRIIYEKTCGKANEEWNINHVIDSKFRLGSISKQFASFIILQLCEQGKLSLNDKLSDYIKGFDDIDKKTITINNLLTHTWKNLDASSAEENAACVCPAVTLSATYKVCFFLANKSLMLFIIFSS